MKYGNLSFHVFCVALLIIVCVSKLVFTVEYAGTNVDQCVLCAYCDPSYRESNKICTNPNDTEYFKDDVDRFEKTRCFAHGDHEELISALNTSHVSILPPSTPNTTTCYLTIMYYNVSEKSFMANDVVFVQYGRNKSRIRSQLGKWEALHRRWEYKNPWTSKVEYKKDLEYDIIALKGKIFVRG